MKLLFITSLVPIAAPKSGFDIVNRVLVEALLALGVNVHIVGYLTPGERPAYPERTSLLGALQVTNARVSRFQKASWLAKSISAGLPVSCVKMHQVSDQQFLKAIDACGGDAFGAHQGYILNSVQLGGAFHHLLKDKNYIYIAHNVEWQSALKNADCAAHFMTRALFMRESHLLRHVEEQLCGHAQHVFTLADDDRHGLDIEDHSSTLPMVTQARYVRPDYCAAFSPFRDLEKLCDIGLIGSWSWAANRSGLDWFLNRIVPKLPADFSINIAGLIDDGPQNTPDNVVFKGRVECAEEFIHSCRVVPLVSQQGTGVQLKTLETFEYGLANVATKSSVRGIDYRPPNGVIADNDDDFIKALITQVQLARRQKLSPVNGQDFIAHQTSQLMATLKSGLLSAQMMKAFHREAA